MTISTPAKTGKGKKETTSSHSVRTPNVTWAKATTRAGREGVPINRVIIELLEGYIRGVYRLPDRQTQVVRNYPTPKTEAPAEAAPTA